MLNVHFPGSTLQKQDMRDVDIGLTVGYKIRAESLGRPPAMEHFLPKYPRHYRYSEVAVSCLNSKYLIPVSYISKAIKNPEYNSGVRGTIEAGYILLTSL